MREPPNRILEFLTAPAKPDGEACRSNSRRRSSSRIELAWLEGSTWRTIPGRLRDISRGGASLVALIPPPMTRLARIRFVERDGSPWIEAEVLDVERDDRKRHRVRLKFESPCPSFVLGLAVLDSEEPTDKQPATRYEWVAWEPGAHESV